MYLRTKNTRQWTTGFLPSYLRQYDTTGTWQYLIDITHIPDKLLQYWQQLFDQRILFVHIFLSMTCFPQHKSRLTGSSSSQDSDPSTSAAGRRNGQVSCQYKQSNSPTQLRTHIIHHHYGTYHCKRWETRRKTRASYFLLPYGYSKLVELSRLASTVLKERLRKYLSESKSPCMSLFMCEHEGSQ